MSKSAWHWLLVLVVSQHGSEIIAQQKAAPKRPAVPANVTVTRDVEYGKVGDRALVLDVIQPKEPKSDKLPWVVWIHGGGWRGDSKGDHGAVMRLVQRADYVGASVGYRLSGEAVWPAQIHDCKAAIRFLRSHAKDYGADPDRIGVFGASAGGHLVTLLGETDGVSEFEGNGGTPGVSTKVTCVVNYFGPSDLVALHPVLKPKDGSPSLIEHLIGGSIEEKGDLAKQASPLQYATEYAAPMLTVHGTKDPIVPFSQAEALHQALTKAGASSLLLTIDGGLHGAGCFTPEALNRVTKFFDKHLHGKNAVISTEPIVFTPPPPKKT